MELLKRFFARLERAPVADSELDSTVERALRRLTDREELSPENLRLMVIGVLDRLKDQEEERNTELNNLLAPYLDSAPHRHALKGYIKFND